MSGRRAEAKPTLHVALDPSTAGSIGQAIRRLGRREPVIGSMDNLSFGPIDPPSVGLRQQWAAAWLACDFYEVAQRAELFWIEATSRKTVPVVWVCRQDPAEYCGFLEFLWRMADAPFRLIDITGLELIDVRWRTSVARSFGIVSPDQMIEARLWDRQTTPAPDEVQRYRELWGRLRKENAPRRVVNETGLVSAPGGV